MNYFFEQLYESLLAGIHKCELTQTDSRQYIECCFHITESINLLVDKKVADTGFDSREAEIVFFKTVRPKFSSLVEYYSILYSAELFLPEDEAELKEFWNHELKRVNQFLAKNQEFQEYLMANRSDKDGEYFLRTSPDDQHASHDYLAAQIMAREKYREYIEKKLS